MREQKTGFAPLEEGSKFRPLTVVLPIEKIMKEAIRMVPESIYDPEFPDTSHFRCCHSALRRIKEEWGTSRWFLEFEKCFHTIDRHRLIPIFKEEIDDPKFFYQKAGRLVGGGPYSVPHSVLLSALPGNIYLHKLDQEIGRIRQKYEIPIVQRIRSVLLKTSRIDDQENSGEEESFNAPQDNRAIIVDRVIQRKAASWHNPPASTPRLRGDQKRPFVLPPLAAFLNKPSSLLFAALLAGLADRECFWAMRVNYCKRKGLLIEIELGEAGILRSEKGPYPPLLNKIRICYARYADDLLLGIVGAVELLIEIQKRIAHFLQSGLNLWVGSATIAARSTVEFLGTVIREVPPKTTPIQFLRELEKRLRVKYRIHITACSAKFSKSIPIPIKQLMSKTRSLLDAVQLAETLGTARVRSPQVSILWEHIRQGSRSEGFEISLLHSSGQSSGQSKVVPPDVQQVVGMSARKLSLYTLAGRGRKGEGGGNLGQWARSISSEFQIEAPIKKILRRLRDRGLISRIRPWPIHVACLTNVSDGDIVNWFAGIAISPLSYYRCRDNLYQVRTIVDYQIRWSAIFTLAHKLKSSARNIILKYSKSKDLNIVNQEGGKTPRKS